MTQYREGIHVPCGREAANGIEVCIWTCISHVESCLLLPPPRRLAGKNVPQAFAQSVHMYLRSGVLQHATGVAMQGNCTEGECCDGSYRLAQGALEGRGRLDCRAQRSDTSPPWQWCI